ncbi:MAG: molybdopterin molybdenumtransferase MoeA [Anaerolineaceae bacterium]|nr:molybdopterin molybdenumtransferase MoeA [Anaerolineaceae bacterium]
MPEFLKLVSIEEARQVLFNHLISPCVKEEEIETLHARGRILSRDIFADEDLPAFTRSAMDGFAVRASDTNGASDTLPAYLTLAGEVEMGKAPEFTLEKGHAAVIHTGGMLPDGADAVVIMENTQMIDSCQVEIHKPVASGDNLILKGEDVRAGELVMRSGTLVRPEEIGGLLALGKTKIFVFAKPVVHIFSSGDELVDAGNKLQPGQVRDINSPILAAFVESCGAIPVLHPIVPDDARVLEDALRQIFSDADLMIITAGSSASTRDMTAEVISHLGTPGVLVHGINIRPGKPTIVAVCDGKPIIGLPGNPVSALIIARQLVKPLLEKLNGRQDLSINQVVEARLSLNLASVAGRDDYLPAVLEKSDQGFKVTPIFFKSNLILSLSRANGLIHIPADVTGYSAGDTVEVFLL